jgi:hypothetical protein
MGRHVASVGEKRNAYRVLVGKQKEPLGSPRRRWEDNIKMDFRVMGWWWYGLDSSGSGWRLVECCFEYCNEPSGFMRYWEIIE